ncbi:988_t:CDS:2 [Ambispora gerdemannii]|uniref:988_t:CDS:1 n=1 Tax=Ambispora gerdemannii TaxID=144530 RepID=A0A9N9G9A3_9GLOM|nr:988_t:CDS:2 [Ambispora gerdemannii]
MSDTLYPFRHPRPMFKDRVNESPQHFTKYAAEYVKSLYPIKDRIEQYNLIWLMSDVIAGLTVGAVVIPQGMAYAKIAELAPEYGLYTSFVGVSIYALFATSKDITIGQQLSFNIGKSTSPIVILTTVPKCFSHVGVPPVNSEVLCHIISYIPMIAIGITNVIGPFLRGYGYFLRTALKSKSGVRTPLADIFSAILVVLALYFLTPAFYYIPDSALAK